MPKQPFIQSVEAARGLAAIEVLAYHVVEIFKLHDFVHLKYLLYPFSFGHEAVILFFVLSGFSIHYNYAVKNLAHSATIKTYYFSRWLRLYPLLICALLLTAALVLIGDWSSTPAYSGLWNRDFAQSILASSMFAVDLRAHSGYWIATPRTNPPIWSLSYEALYYVVYPLLWWASNRFNLIAVMLAAALVSLIAILSNSYLGANHIANVFSYYLIWVLGALLAHIRLNTIRVNNYPFTLIGIALSLLILKMVLRDYSTILGDYLLASSVVIIAFTVYSQPNSRKATASSLLLFATIFTFLALLISRFSEFVYQGSTQLLLVKIGIIGCIGFLLLKRSYFNQLIRFTTKRFLITGSVSYGIYIFHYPILVASHAYLSPLVGSVLSITIGISVVAGVAYLMERVAYPLLKRRLTSASISH